jgi:hypothetical protein
LVSKYLLASQSEYLSASVLAHYINRTIDSSSYRTSAANVSKRNRRVRSKIQWNHDTG